ncbi:3-hydroxyacyl-CoA dehydrogenase NAD-binding domain-containing protein [Pseudomonas citronellolis]|uniref:3-hydroxyacyl-CoA dehydrogenase NAD-binding domain-containing protein n=1 Tax=Pseudomonas citronellolis TaxID=53408 RepID=UPI000852F5D7|nr:3-hydroxyacyl-CoA dehydrogenase NAD-binding domain-containing protein [Pseudomonas humi]
MNNEAAVADATSAVRLEQSGDVGVVVVDNPPVNAGSLSVRQGLLDALNRIESMPSLVGAVIMGAGKTFIAGSDIREFDRPIEAPSLPDVIARIETLSKPVVAAIHGAALGGGFELALGCDARIAQGGAVVGLPEVSLGMIPGAGGTQRVAFLVGQATAIEIVTSSRRIGAAEALRLGLVDEVVAGDLLGAAISHIRSLAGRKQRVRDRALPHSDDAQTSAAIEAALRRGKGRRPVALAIDAVKMAGSLPFDEALLKERAIFQALRSGPEAAALRHLFFAERACLRTSAQAHPKVRQVGVIGAGTMGSGIAGCFADAGFEVTLVDRDAETAQAGIEKLGRHYRSQVARGRLTEAEGTARLARVRPSADLHALADADLVIEAVFEDLEVKREVMRRLDALIRPEAILASNTSYLDLDELAACTASPSRVVGLHFFSPAQTMRLLEVVRTRYLDEAVLNGVLGIARQLNKVPVVSRVAEGFIGNRIYAAYRRQCEIMLEDGAYPEQIDAALEAFGFAMGPFAVADLSGLDIAWNMRKRLGRGTNDTRYVDIPDLLCMAGRFGRKSGAGYYRYESSAARGSVDPWVHDVIDQERARKGLSVRHLEDGEIVERALAAIVNEAAKVLDEGTARCADDIDVVLVNGYGFPRHVGGPLWWARQVGEARLDELMGSLAHASGAGHSLGDWRRAIA